MLSEYADGDDKRQDGAVGILICNKLLLRGQRLDNKKGNYILNFTKKTSG